MGIFPQLGLCLWKNWSELSENFVIDVRLDKDVFNKCWKLSGSGVQTQSIQIPDMDSTPDVDQVRIGSGMLSEYS